ncbi:MAG: hypothetical protein ACRC6M_17805 [Microcystaceae cyanobacterium]
MMSNHTYHIRSSLGRRSGRGAIANSQPSFQKGDRVSQPQK